MHEFLPNLFMYFDIPLMHQRTGGLGCFSIILRLEGIGGEGMLIKNTRRLEVRVMRRNCCPSKSTKRKQQLLLCSNFLMKMKEADFD
jgi:hypothetical protein